MITQTQVNGNVAFETVSRGVDYLAYVRDCGTWVVTSSRLRGSMTVKHFASISEVASKVKAFGNLDALVECEAVA